MSVTTRVATEADLDHLDQIDRHVSRDVLAHLVDDGRVMVADVDGVVVGCLRWGLFWDQVPFMNLLWIVPERRGQGVGTTLVGAWERAHLATGHRLVLTSTSSTERAQHFYRRLGYVDCGGLLLPDEPTELFFRKHLEDDGGAA